MAQDGLRELVGGGVTAHVGVRSSRRAAIAAASTARAICGRLKACSSMRATVRIAPVGFAMPLPAMSGAAPWIGS